MSNENLAQLKSLLKSEWNFTYPRGQVEAAPYGITTTINNTTKHPPNRPSCRNDSGLHMINIHSHTVAFKSRTAEITKEPQSVNSAWDDPVELTENLLTRHVCHHVESQTLSKDINFIIYSLRGKEKWTHTKSSFTMQFPYID